MENPLNDLGNRTAPFSSPSIVAPQHVDEKDRTEVDDDDASSSPPVSVNELKLESDPSHTQMNGSPSNENGKGVTMSSIVKNEPIKEEDGRTGSLSSFYRSMEQNMEASVVARRTRRAAKSRESSRTVKVLDDSSTGGKPRRLHKTNAKRKSSKSKSTTPRRKRVRKEKKRPVVEVVRVPSISLLKIETKSARQQLGRVYNLKQSRLRQESHSDVFVVERKRHLSEAFKTFAIKRQYLGSSGDVPDITDRPYRELRILLQLKQLMAEHRCYHFVQLRGYVKSSPPLMFPNIRCSKDDQFLYFELEYAQDDLQGYLQSLPGPMSVQSFRTILFQLIYALLSAQRQYQFVHNDLHWRNILIQSVEDSDRPYCAYRDDQPEHFGLWYTHGLVLKITDFGLSRMTLRDGDTVYNPHSPHSIMELFDAHRDLRHFSENYLPKIASKWVDWTSVKEDRDVLEGRKAYNTVRRLIRKGQPLIQLLHHSFFDPLRVKPSTLIPENCTLQCLNGMEGLPSLETTIRGGGSSKQLLLENGLKRLVPKHRKRRGGLYSSAECDGHSSLPSPSTSNTYMEDSELAAALQSPVKEDGLRVRLRSHDANRFTVYRVQKRGRKSPSRNSKGTLRSSSPPSQPSSPSKKNRSSPTKKNSKRTSSPKVGWKRSRKSSNNPSPPLSSPLKQCELVLQRLLKLPGIADSFGCPVDPIALNLPDYHSIIQNPMDLGTVSQRLSDGKYSGKDEFASDVRLVFDNAQKYRPNDEGNDIPMLAKSASSIFESEFTAIDVEEKDDDDDEDDDDNDDDEWEYRDDEEVMMEEWSSNADDLSPLPPRSTASSSSRRRRDSIDILVSPVQISSDLPPYEGDIAVLAYLQPYYDLPGLAKASVYDMVQAFRTCQQRRYRSIYSETQLLGLSRQQMHYLMYHHYCEYLRQVEDGAEMSV